jgi:hypothetical protein
VASKVYSFRADRDLAARIENQAYLEGITEAQLLARAVQRYLGSLPEQRARRRLEVVLSELLLCSHYNHLLVKKTFGEATVEASKSHVEWQAREQVRALFDGIDRGEE